MEQKFQLHLIVRGRPWQIKAVGPDWVWSKGQLGSSVGSLGLCLPAARLCLGAAHSVLGESLVSVSAEECSLKEMVLLVSDVHVQGCHSLVILQRLVLLLTSCWRLACISWGKSGHPALKIAEDNWLLRSLQSVCGRRGNKSVHELLVSLSNMWLSSLHMFSLPKALTCSPNHPKCNLSQIQVGFRRPVCDCALVVAMAAPGTVPQI